VTKGLRAGSFDAAKPDWRGVIRHEGYPWYVCTHRDHGGSAEARQCAREALEWMRANDGLPEKWITYKSYKEFFS
jgi:hypothetical protein